MKPLALAVAATVMTFVAGKVVAEDRTYEAWKDPDAPADAQYQTPEHTEALVQELTELLRAGRRDRAAAPAFLDDLQAAIERHRQADRDLIAATAPPPVLPRIANVEDDFSDGDFTRNPAWELARGEFFVARGARLFSFVQGQQQAAQPQSDGDAVVKLFGTLLGANQQNSRDTGSVEPSAIFLPAEITNAFDLRTRLMSDERLGGVFELGVYQGNRRESGYRLQFAGDGKARLIRVGRSVVVLRDADFRFPALQNRRPGTYDVQWVRDRDGLMTVSVDGVVIMRATDNGFRDDFEGFRLINAEGRHGMDAIRIVMDN